MAEMIRPARHPATRPWIPVLAALLLAVAGCGDDDPAGPGGSAVEGSALAGSWAATSFSADGFDAVSNGTTVVITFTVTGSTAPAFRGATGTWAVQIDNDSVGVCDGATSCSPTGLFTVEGTTLLFDPGTEDEQVWTWSVVGNTLSLSTVFADTTVLEVQATRVS
jgi:hypothetical protein